MNTLKINSVEEKIIKIRGISIIIDSDVAEHYGVETKRINEAVRNNPEKFPDGYIMEIVQSEKNELVENFDRFNKLKHSTVFPTAFTEKGLYMLATILKSKRATEATIEIVEAFAKIRELSRTVNELYNARDEEKQKNLVQKGGELISDILSNDLKVTDSETTFEINAALFKVKHTVKRKLTE